MQTAIITATMQDGTIIREVARTFEAFTGLVLAFRRDPDCVRLAWEVIRPEPPIPTAELREAYCWPVRLFIGEVA